ncbi:MAG: hypothetical protein GOU97_03165 [Nanoarchaeota archaeon]|nr:hypothetical protein [Nanoarchaeota archaeon]
MKIKQAYLKSLIRAIISLTISIIFIILLTKTLYTPSYYFTDFTCTQLQKNSSACSFECRFIPRSNYSDASKELKLNFKIHFFKYNGVLDKTINATLNQKTTQFFSLPRREYIYGFTVLAYDEKGRGGNVAASLFC